MAPVAERSAYFPMKTEVFARKIEKICKKKGKILGFDRKRMLWKKSCARIAFGIIESCGVALQREF